MHIWFWMAVSGLVGFVFGDFFLFRSYEFISARISMLMMSLSPPIAAFISWIALGEMMAFQSLLAMAVTIGGIIIVITEKKKNKDEEKKGNNRIKIKYPLRGLFFAFAGALGQAGGLVISKYGMTGYDVFAATQIRVITGVFGFIVLIFILRQWGSIHKAVKDRKALKFIAIGAFFGPFIGVYSSLLSVKYTSVGIASTIMAIVPVLIIPPAIMLFKEKVTLKEIIGSIITVGGVALFFL
jgi:drug/metabolite transporter (DMT)-like permease